MRNKIIFFNFLSLLSISFISQLSWAADAWNIDGDYHYTQSAYSDNTLKEKSTGQGFNLNASYLEQFEFALSAEKKQIHYRDGFADIGQNEFSLSGNYHSYPDFLAGRLTLTADAMSIRNDDNVGITDELAVLAPSLSYLTFDKKYYVDIGYAHSDYPSDLQVQQWTNTYGMAFSQGYDWLQGKFYFIAPDSSAENALLPEVQYANTEAVEFLWRHWTKEDNLLHINNFFVTALIGERIFAVDTVAHSAFNLTDVQTSAYKLSAEWLFENSLKLTFLTGVAEFETAVDQSDYTEKFIYLNLNKQW